MISKVVPKIWARTNSAMMGALTGYCVIQRNRRASKATIILLLCFDVYRDPFLDDNFFFTVARNLADSERFKAVCSRNAESNAGGGESPDVSGRQDEDHRSVRMKESRR